MATFKLQSAMEYLMTYGWALLIISIVIVALVSIGVFNGSPLGTTCIASPGFTCQVVQYAATGGSGTPPGGNILVIIGQDSGTTWSTATVYFVNASQESAVVSGGLSSSYGSNVLSGGLASGVTTSVTLPASSLGTRTGSSINGYVWVSYTTSGTSGATVQSQLASISAKST